jgi:hypothetical protein
MPSEMPNFILRGARLATIMVRRPSSLLGSVGALDAGEHVALLVADVQGQAQQLVGAFDVLGLDDQRDAQVDGGEGRRS